MIACSHLNLLAPPRIFSATVGNKREKVRLVTIFMNSSPKSLSDEKGGEVVWGFQLRHGVERKNDGPLLLLAQHNILHTKHPPVDVLLKYFLYFLFDVKMKQELVIIG